MSSWPNEVKLSTAKVLSWLAEKLAPGAPGVGTPYSARFVALGSMLRFKMGPSEGVCAGLLRVRLWRRLFALFDPLLVIELGLLVVGLFVLLVLLFLRWCPSWLVPDVAAGAASCPFDAY